MNTTRTLLDRKLNIAEVQRGLARQRMGARIALCRELETRRRALRLAATRARADALTKHADDLIALSRARPPRDLFRAMDGSLTATPFAFESLGPDFSLPSREDLWWGQWMRRLEQRLRDRLPQQNESTTPPPMIETQLGEIDVGGTYTVFGANFGPAGTVDLNIPGRAPEDLQVQWWSNAMVTFTVSDTIDAVPYDQPAWVVLRRDSGGYDGQQVVLQPLDDVFTSSDSFSDSGNSIWGYDEHVTFKSAVLPSSFRLHEVASSFEVGRGCVGLEGTLEEFLVFGADIDVGAPSVDTDTNRIRCTVHLEQEVHWDFDIEARFFIRVPRGISAGDWE